MQSHSTPAFHPSVIDTAYIRRAIEAHQSAAARAKAQFYRELDEGERHLLLVQLRCAEREIAYWTARLEQC